MDGGRIRTWFSALVPARVTTCQVETSTMAWEAPEHLALLTCLTSLLIPDLPWLTRSTPLYSVPLLMLPFLPECLS